MIYLLGSGIYSFFDLTLYTQHLLQSCQSVFYLHDLPSLERYLARLTSNPINLMPLYYVDGRKRSDIYVDITDHVIRGGLENPPVAFLMHGHPLVFSSISQMIIQEGKRVGLPVTVVPALSSLDRMFVDLGLDISTRGIQVLHTSMAVSTKLSLNPLVDVLFMQIGAIQDNRASRKKAVMKEQILPFKRYLLDFYPGSHTLSIIECAVELGYESRRTDISIEDLEEAAPVFNYNASAYLPGLP